MTWSSRNRACASLLVPMLLASASIAAARDDAPKVAPESRPASTTETEPLRGPSAATPVARATIVEREFSGALKRVEGDPTLAALAKIELTPEQRAACARVIDERHAALDRLVADNLKEIVAIHNAKQSGDKEELRTTMRALYTKAKGVLKQTRLSEELKGVLPEAKHAELTNILAEYYAAAIRTRSDAAARETASETAGKEAALFDERRAASAELLVTFGAELKSSYARVFGSRKEDFEKLLGELNLTPEQDAKVRQIVTDAFQKSLGKPTPAQNARMVLEIAGLLSLEQRKLVLDKLRAMAKDH